MKMFLPDTPVSTTGSGRMVNTYQQVYLEAGTNYVFSGYANLFIQSFSRRKAIPIMSKNLGFLFLNMAEN